MKIKRKGKPKWAETEGHAVGLPRCLPILLHNSEGHSNGFEN